MIERAPSSPRIRHVAASSRGRVRSRSFAGSTGCCSRRRSRLVGYGLWVVSGHHALRRARRRELLRRPPGHRGRARRRRARRRGGDPDRSRTAALAARLRRDARAHGRRLRRRRDDPRLEALDRSRLHPVPALGARQGPLRPRDRRIPRRARRTRRRAGGRSSRRSGSARSRSCSSSSSRTSAPRSSTRPRSSPFSSSSASAGASCSRCSRSACIGIAAVLWLLPGPGSRC